MSSMVAVACFLRGRANDLSAPPRTVLGMAQNMFIKFSYSLVTINISTYPSDFETDRLCGMVLGHRDHKRVR